MIKPASAQNREIAIGREYAHIVFKRGVEPLPPVGFEPNWSDQPSRFKLYQDAQRFALALDLPPGQASMAELMARMWNAQPRLRELTLDELALMLYLASGVLSRRLRPNWSQDARTLAVYHATSTVYARGTASGGGMYPTEIYWACGSRGPLLPGLYHYDNGHHAMERLYTGDLTRHIQAATFDHPQALASDQFLLITLNFWKNSFKYNNFCYHVVTQDLGALFCSLWFMAMGLRSDLEPILWFQDEPLNQMLGLDMDHESVFAILPIAMSGGTAASVAERSAPSLADLTASLVRKTAFQRSQTVLTFDLTQRMHRAALLADEPRPAARVNVDELYDTGEPLALPAPTRERLAGDVVATFQQRRSSFGLFAPQMPLSQQELATILAFGSATRNYHSDITKAGDSAHFTRLMVFIQNVAGIERGAYSYDQRRHCLWNVRRQDLVLFLQNHYFLPNYNIADSGILIAIVGNLEKMLEVYGNRGYRLLNFEAGLVAQGIYMGATALSLGCGAALGFDNLALNGMLGLDGTDQTTLLFLLVGHERQYVGDIDYRLV